MTSGRAKWQHIYRRLLGMDGAEIADRIRQQLTARADLMRYKGSLGFGPGLRDGLSTTRPHFFFEPEAVPGLCSKLRQFFPETAEQIMEHAEKICAHRFDLLGYRGVDYGAEIDWRCDRVHGKCAPRKPWFQMKYLDFEEVGDSKITWELNRHQHLVILAKAFRLSGNEKFAVEVFRQWDHWHAENPYPIGINWASSLEVAFRSLSWLWVYFLLADSTAMPSGFRNAWLRSLAVAGRHIECYLSTYFSPNTHLLGEGVGLFFIGTLCPEISGSARWRQRGWRIVQEEARRQVRADGLHFEQSLYYHVYALDFFLHAAVLASLNPPAPEFDRTSFEGIIERMLEVLASLAQSGTMPQLGDDDGGRLFDASRNRGRHLFDPLATGTILFGRGDFKTLAGGLREETLWLLGEAGVEEFERIAPVSTMRNSHVFRASGLYVMTDDERTPRQLVIDAGPQGAHSAGHGHADALSVTASCAARELLIDCGTFEYVGEDAGADSNRNYFRGTRAHNTLLVNGEDQAEPRGPFSWGRLPNVQTEVWIAGKTFDLFVGSHDGYSRLANPVVHRRFVFSLKSSFWLVRDQALGFGEYPLDLFWHLAPSLHTVSDERNIFLGEDHGLQVTAVEGNGWAQSVEDQPHSAIYGQKENHKTLHFATTAQLPTEFVTVLHPLVQTSASDEATVEANLTRISGSSSTPSFAVGYCYQRAGDEYCIFFSQGKPWKSDQWNSDAEFLCYVREETSRRQTLICCNGTFVEWSGCAVVTAKRAFQRCEVIAKGDQLEVVSSDPEQIVLDREGWKKLMANEKKQPAGSLAMEKS